MLSNSVAPFVPLQALQQASAWVQRPLDLTEAAAKDAVATQAAQRPGAPKTGQG